MKIKIVEALIGGEKTVFEEDVAEKMSNETADAIEGFGDREVVSITLKFNSGLLFGSVTDMSDIEPEMVRETIIKIKGR